MAVLRLCFDDPERASIADRLGIDVSRREERWYIPACTYWSIRPIGCSVLLLTSALAIIWRFNMNHPLAFLLLDFMNICICVFAVKASELRSLRVSLMSVDFNAIAFR